MKLLIISCLAATSLGQLIHHPGGAITPIHHANLHATANHLATRFGYVHGYYGKREAEADPQLVQHWNGAVTPIHHANFVATQNHLLAKFGHFGKREAEADPQLVYHLNGAVTPFHAANFHATAAHLATKGFVYGKREAEADPQFLVHALPYAYFHPLVAHPNGALVPLEPADVQKARAEHLAAKAAA